MTGQLWHGQTSNTPAQQAPANELHPTRFLSRPMFGELDRWPTLLAPPLAPGGLLACHGIFPDADRAELRRRIEATQWPERETVEDAPQGVPLATMQERARYWATEH